MPSSAGQHAARRRRRQRPHRGQADRQPERGRQGRHPRPVPARRGQRSPRRRWPPWSRTAITARCPGSPPTASARSTPMRGRRAPPAAPRASPSSSAASASMPTAAISAIALPGAVTLALAPYGTDLKTTMADARAAGHELLLQVPLEPFNYPRTDPGPHTLTVDAAADENIDRLHWLMSRFTNYVGVVNYMGARFTGEAEALTARAGRDRLARPALSRRRLLGAQPRGGAGRHHAGAARRCRARCRSDAGCDRPAARSACAPSPVSAAMPSPPAAPSPPPSTASPLSPRPPPIAASPSSP